MAAGAVRVLEVFRRMDERLAEAVTVPSWPVLERWMPRLSRSADHMVVWWVAAAALAGTGRPVPRAAARHGLAAMLLAGPVCNAVGKRLVDRGRPPEHLRHRHRHRGRVPDSGAFPSGHAAAAAAFATAVALESRPAGTVMAALAGLVTVSRVYTGAHYPGDVTAGAAAGVCTAVWLRRRRTAGPGRDVRS
jgi:membrane-associated phospholipid phosphatase